MTKLRTLTLAAALSFASVALAHADGAAVTGTWKLSIGLNDAPCTLNLTAGSTGAAGDAVPSSDCGQGLADITHWKATGRGIQLYSGSDELIAWLNPKADAYVGDRISDGRKLALNR